MSTLYLIDGYAQFFRAYHAIRTPMTSPVTKEPTNMTFGFVGMLLKLLRLAQADEAAGRGPVSIAVALDVSGDRGTFRSEIYPEYKATRPPAPEDLEPQVERCLALLREIGVPIIGAPGFEADDVIATVVDACGRLTPPPRVRMISKDKDLKQLLRPADTASGGVELFDIHTDAVFTVETLHAESGLNPAQVVDMLTLMGDTVDNVPGVPGVGEKTAALLLREHGSLEGVLAAAPAMPGKRGENIRAAAATLALSRQLVTLRRDTPIELDLAQARVVHFHPERLMPALRELGFNRYQTELRALIEPSPASENAAPAGSASTAPAQASGALPSDDLTLYHTTLERPAPERPAPEYPVPRSHAGLSVTIGLPGGLFDGLTGAPGPSHPVNRRYECVRTRERLAEVLALVRAAPEVAVDTETTSASPMRAALCGVSLSIEPGAGFYIPVRSPEPHAHLAEADAIDLLRPVLEDPRCRKIGHNLKYDIIVLRACGVRLRGLACDTMVASYLIDSARSSHSLDALALALLRHTNIPLSDLIGSGREQRTFETAPLDLATQYAAEDADISLRLAQLMRPQLRAMGLERLMDEVEMPLVDVLAELEWNGIIVDAAELDRQRARLLDRAEALLASIHAESRAALGRAFDPDSPRQLGVALFNGPDDDPPGLGLRSLKKTKTGYSTDAEVLEKLAQDATIRTPIPTLILEYRQLTKLVSTYLVALKEEVNPRTGRVHTSFHQTVAATGRLASSDPNLQNIPIRTELGREIRRAFVAPPDGVLITADYSQIELRLLAHLSRDPGLIAAFQADADIHTEVAAQIHGVPPAQVTREQRGGAKMVNFGIVYGITAFGLARRLNITEKQAAEIIAGYKRRFAGITTFLEECVDQARRYGYVETMLKRRRPIPEIDARTPARRALAERTAINSVVQGSAADLIKVAMVDLHQRIHAAQPGEPLHTTRMLLQIHDELVFECPAAHADAATRVIVERMEQSARLCVPLKVDAHAAPTWYDG